MIRVLHSVSNMDRGGIETMLMNYYRHFDRGRVQFDFLCNKQKPGDYDDEIIRLGGRIFRSPGLSPLKYPEYLRYMKELFGRYPEYRIVHAHNEALGAYALHAARVNSIPIRICHAHNIRIGFDLKWPLKRFCLSRLKEECNFRWACGRDAACFYFGAKAVESGAFRIVHNAIEVGRFIFSEEIRRIMREKHSLSGKTVVGHIGRFSQQKNHAFIVDIFERFHQTCPDSALVLLGEGELRRDIEALTDRKGLRGSVHFMGSVANPHEWYQAFDAFLLPSKWEGLPLVGVEAQAASLPCVFSDCVPREVSITDRVHFLSLNDDAKTWANTLRRAIENNKRVDMTRQISGAGYDINTAAITLQRQYEDLIADNLL